MDSASLTREQVEKLIEVIGRQLNYLGRLRKRMEAMRFPHNDPIYLDVSAAWDATQRLSVRLHYLSCRPGTVG